MRAVLALLIALLLYLQILVWFGKGGVRDVNLMRVQVAAQESEILRLKERNQTLAAEVADLKQGLEAIEERARSEMGMVKEGETFYQIIPPENAPGNGEDVN